MVKKRKGRVLIDSDTEDSGSEENLDQVRGEARPERGAWDLRPAQGSVPPSPPSFLRSRLGAAPLRRPPQPYGGTRGLRGESPLLFSGSLACPGQAARDGDFRGLFSAGPVFAGGRHSAGRRGDAPGRFGPEEGGHHPSGSGRRGPWGWATFLCCFRMLGELLRRAACQVSASR